MFHRLRLLLFGHICRLPENTPASQALQLSIEAHTGTPPAADWKRPPGRPRSTEKLAAAIGRRQWPICWCCLDRGPGSFDVEDATTLSWSSAAVSEWVSESPDPISGIYILPEMAIVEQQFTQNSQTAWWPSTFFLRHSVYTRDLQPLQWCLLGSVVDRCRLSVNDLRGSTLGSDKILFIYFCFT